MSSPDINKIIAKRPAKLQERQNYQNFKQKTFVQQLPLWKRYTKTFVFGGAFLSFCILYSAPIYYIFRDPPEHIDPRETMWPGELRKGKTYAVQLRERREKYLKEKAENTEKMLLHMEAMKKKTNSE